MQFGVAPAQPTEGAPLLLPAAERTQTAQRRTAVSGVRLSRVLRGARRMQDCPPKVRECMRSVRERSVRASSSPAHVYVARA
jgi:hypothetical protein